MNSYLKLFLCAVFAGLLFLTGCATGSPAPKEAPDPATQEEIISTNPNLEQVSLLDGKVDILLPKDFTIMSDEMAEMKYPSEKRPPLIYTDEEGTVNAVFNLTTDTLSGSQVPQMTDYMVNMFKELYPSAEWLGEGTEKVGGRTIGYAELITPGYDTDIYNLMWFTDVNGRMLLCSFNCMLEQMDEWQPVAHEIKNSFRVK